MRVLIDVDPLGFTQEIETDPTQYHAVQHPDNATGLVGIDVMLRHHNENPQAREIGGWHVVNQLPGETEPITRWQRLVRACNGPHATEQARSLGLKE